MTLTERCSWDGALIVACSPWDVMAAVQRHQATPVHIEARHRVAKVEANRMYRLRLRTQVHAVRMLREVRV